MTRPAKPILAILVAATPASCGREGTLTGPSGQTSFLTGTWRGTVTIQVNPGDPNAPPPMSGEMTWNVRGRAANEHAVAAHHNPVDTPMAHNGDHRIDGAVTQQQSAIGDQHTWRVQLTARLSRDVWKRRYRGGGADRS